MKNTFALVLIPLFAFAASAMVPATSDASPPFVEFGLDCDNWIQTSDPWDSGKMLCDETGDFYDCSHTLIQWPPFQLDLWIEYEARIYFGWTNAKMHRASLYDDIVLTMNCWVEQNGAMVVIIWKDGAGDQNGQPYDLDQLNFIYDSQHNWPDPRTPGAQPIPITWWYNIEGAGWLPMIEFWADPDAYYFLLLDECHTDFSIRIIIDIVEHEEDGWYKLAGTLCPVPAL